MSFLAARLPYGIAGIILFIVLVGIAEYGGGFVRHTVGDGLAVGLFYLGWRFLRPKGAPLTAALIAFAAACFIESGQFFHLAHRLGVAGTRLGDFVLGQTFDPLDVLAYALGVLCFYLLDSRFFLKALLPGKMGSAGR